MADELRHENGDEYPRHFANRDTLSSPVLKHLCPYVFKKDQEGQKKEFLGDLRAYHEKITKKEVNQALEKLGRISKKNLFGKESPFFVKIEGYGNYRYIGRSVGDGFSKPVITPETDAIAGQITPDKELSARNEGRESLYVWWHKDSEELAKLKNHDCWAMKIGKHNSPNVSARFESYRVAIPHKIRLGLIISCKKCSQLEKAVHTVLENRGQKIGEEGSEWFNTNVNEILDVLRFQHLIE